MEYSYGNDISKWQVIPPYKTPPYFQRAEERGIKLVCVKKSQGLAQDPAFGVIWNALKLHPNIKRTVYHWFEPTIKSGPQIDAFLAGLTPADITAPMWLDVERQHSMNKSEVLKRLLEMLYAVKEWSGKKVAIYTRKSIFDPFYSNRPGWGNDWLLVVAHYGAANPAVPAGWPTWDGWQFSADGNKLGSFFGYQSASVDMDLLKPSMLGDN